MSNYRAIIFDLDGTAVPSHREGKPSPRLLAAIKAARRRGLRLMAASGRSLPYGISLLKSLGLSDPCVLGGGTMLIDPATGHIIEQSVLPSSSVEQVMKTCERFSLDVYRPSARIKTPRTIIEPNDPIEPMPYIGIPGITSENLTTVMTALAQIPGVVAASSPDWDGGHYIQVTNANATKEHRIAQALAKLGINKADAIAVGDADNDIHLFAAVGHRVAMGNASDELKSIADEVAPSIDEDGLAVIIERYTKAYEANRSTPAV